MPEAGNMYVRLSGIDMELEVWGLIRLFFDEDRIIFLHDDNIPDPPAGSRLITLTVSPGAVGNDIETCLYKDINDNSILANSLNQNLSPDIRDYSDFENTNLSGININSNAKIKYGTSLYNVLSKEFGKVLPYGSLLGVRPVKLASKCLEEGLSEKETLELLRKTTGMSEEKANLLVSVAVTEKKYETTDDNLVNIYIGIPFCASRCLYCSFASYPIDRMKNIVEPYVDALCTELEFGRRMVQESGLKINSIYLGGGTPTALPEEDFRRLLFTIQDCFSEALEFTVEAGRPDSIDRGKLLLIKNSGATRISINPQTMNQETLKIIGRNHTPEEITDRYNLARELGFDNINMDIIAGLPGENPDMFDKTLECVETLGPDSLTVHTMAYKRASRLKQERESYPVSDDSFVERMIDAARISAGKMGMEPYYLYRQKNILANLENTGYAKPGKACIYNIQTMTEKQSVIAFGAGAISKCVDTRRQIIKRDDNIKDAAQYIARIDEMIARKEKLFRD